VNPLEQPQKWSPRTGHGHLLNNGVLVPNANEYHAMESGEIRRIIPKTAHSKKQRRKEQRKSMAEHNYKPLSLRGECPFCKAGFIAHLDSIQFGQSANIKGKCPKCYKDISAVASVAIRDGLTTIDFSVSKTEERKDDNAERKPRTEVEDNEC
jgi:hypothetical protein